MSKKFNCPRCNIYLSSKQMLDFHLYKRKKPCSDHPDTNFLPHESHTKLCDSTRFHVNFPENSRKTPVKLPKNPENLRKTPVKLPTFPENSRITKKKTFSIDFDTNEISFDLSNNINQLIVNEKSNKEIIMDDIDDQINESFDSKYKKEHICSLCGQYFSRLDSLKRHSEKYCKMRSVSSELIHIPSNNPGETTKLEEEINLLKRRIEEMEKKDQKHNENFEKLKSESRVVHNHNNQILQILCVDGNHNYLDMLTKQWGDYDKALCFIKECALSSLIGDCKLLEKIYFSSDNPSEFPIKYLDKNRKKLEYLNEKKEKIIDPQGIRLAKILANNLQNSYLQGVNYLINQTLDNQSCPNAFLDEYDIQSWNNHIYELSDSRYQKKIINYLEIPMVN